MKLKLSINKKLTDNPKLKAVFDALNNSVTEITFINLGVSPTSSGNNYGIFLFSPIDQQCLEFKCRVSDKNNGLFLFSLRQITKDLLPAGDKHLTESCEIEITNPWDQSRPTSNFFDLLNRLDSLQETKIISLADKQKEVAIWEKYIKAVKAIFKNQEELFKISKVGELHKNIIELTIQRENWREIMIKELKEKFPQFPLLSERRNVLEFSIDNTINNLVQNAQDEDWNIEKIKTEMLELIDDHFYKAIGKPVYSAKSLIKLNFFNKVEKQQLGDEIAGELKNSFGISLNFNEDWVAPLSIEDLPCLQSVIDKNYSTIEVCVLRAKVLLVDEQPQVTKAQFLRDKFNLIKKDYPGAVCTLNEKDAVVELLIMNRFEIAQFEKKYGAALKLVKQDFTVKDYGQLQDFEGVQRKGNCYLVEGKDMTAVMNEIKKIRNVYSDTNKTFYKTKYYFELPFQANTKFIEKETQAKLYQNNIEFNGAHTYLSFQFKDKADYTSKIDFIKSLFENKKIKIIEPTEYKVRIRQALDNAEQLNNLIDKAIKKPLLNQYGKDVTFEYEIERHIINVTWVGEFKPFELSESLQNVLSNPDYNIYFNSKVKPEIAQILSFEITENTNALNSFYTKREKTFSNKGSLFLLNYEEGVKFEASRNTFSDEDFGLNVGNIDEWRGNKMVIALNSNILKKIKANDNPLAQLNSDSKSNPEEWLGLFVKPTLSGDLTQYRRLSYAIERIIYPDQQLKRSRKNKLPLFNERLPNFIFDSSTARPITVDSTEEIKPLNNLNERQFEAVKKAINTKDLFILQGPPGTGKTTVIAEIIYQLLKRDPNCKILLTSQTHLAVDNALERLANQSIVKPLRLGSNPESFEEEGQKYYEGNINFWTEAEPGSDSEEKFAKNPVKVWIKNIIDNVPHQNDALNPVLDQWKKGLLSLTKSEKAMFAKRYTASFNVVGATCSLTGSDMGFLMKYDFSKRGFDYVIFDEASKATPPELLIPLLSGKALIIIGDHKQLPPMIDETDFVEKLREIGENTLADEIHEIELEKSHFEKLFRTAFAANNTIVTTLDTQYRMHSKIMEVIDQFYQEEGGLRCGLSEDKIDTPDLKEKGSRWHGLKYKDGSFLSEDNHLLWINVDSYDKHHNPGYSNNGEVIAINKILTMIKTSEGFKNLINYSNKEDDKEIGIITFYANQKNLLRNMVKQSHPDIPVRINTVDKFQGMERNIIIVSTVRNNKEGKIGFAEKLQRINVAFSRPRRLLIIVGNIDHFAFNKSNVPFYARIKSIVEQQNGKRDKKQLDLI